MQRRAVFNLSSTGFLVTILANHDSIPPFNGEYFSNGVQVNFTECFERFLSPTLFRLEMARGSCYWKIFIIFSILK